jgi:hypothetical protein
MEMMWRPCGDGIRQNALTGAQWFVDGQDVHIDERYQDSAAALAHVQRFVQNFASRFLSMCTPTRMSVYGEPSDELKAALTGFNPSYLEPVAGYARS